MPIVTREYLNNLYWERGLTTHEIARIIGKCQATVRKMMLKTRVPLREPRNRPWIKIAPETLKDLYWGKKMTIEQVAKVLGASGSTVHQRMIKFGIPRQRVGEANLKQVKLPFSGDPSEAAYLQSLRSGDLSSRWKGKRVRVEVCTSHPAMVELFRSTFSKYAHVGMCPECNNRLQIFMWRVFVGLDASFSFLIEKSKSIKRDILSSDDLFLTFLAGYTDAEGSIIVSPNRDRIVFCFRICSEDFGLLKGISKKLREMGYHPRLVLDKKKGTNSGFSKLNADYWRLELCRKDEVIQFVQQLPIKHSERRRKRDLLLEIRNETRWVKIKGKVLSLREEIKKEVNECIDQAAFAYHKTHTPRIPKNIEGHEKICDVLEKAPRRESSVHSMPSILCYCPQ